MRKSTWSPVKNSCMLNQEYARTHQYTAEQATCQVCLGYEGKENHPLGVTWGRNVTSGKLKGWQRQAQTLAGVYTSAVTTNTFTQTNSRSMFKAIPQVMVLLLVNMEEQCSSSFCSMPFVAMAWERKTIAALTKWLEPKGSNLQVVGELYPLSIKDANVIVFLINHIFHLIYWPEWCFCQNEHDWDCHISAAGVFPASYLFFYQCPEWQVLHRSL